MSDVALRVDGLVFAGWQEISITLGIQLGDSFDLKLTDKWGASMAARQILPGMPCSVEIDGAKVITGFIDDVKPPYASDSHSVQVTGRDATGDLVDCAALHTTGEWTNTKLDQIAGDLCKPFGIKVAIANGANMGDPFKVWKIEPGETVHECLERASRYRGVLFMADGLGGLLITQAAKSGSLGTLETGKNILGCDPSFSWKERFSDYYVRGQSAGDDETWGADVNQMQGHSVDADLQKLKRYRPTLMIAEDQATPGSMQTRADLQRSINAGRAQAATYTMPGWSLGKNRCRPNNLVTIRDTKLPLNVTWLLSQVEFTKKAETGTLAKLSCMPKEAFTTAAIPPPEEW